MKKQVLLLSALALFLAVGCGEDKGSTQALNFDRSKNLDTGNYQAVLNDPNANATDYAAAAMIAAGLNPVELVKQLNLTASTTAVGDLGAVTQIPINPDNLKYLTIAKDKLAKEIDVACVGMDPSTASQECKDLNFQQTVTSLTTTITALAQVGQGKTLTNATPGGPPVTFNANDGISEDESKALGKYIADTYTASESLTVNTGAPAPEDIVTLVAKYVATIAGTNGSLALSGLGGSKLETTLNSITTDINGAGGTVTPTDITNYLNTNFAKK